MPAKKLLQLSIKLSYEFPGRQGNEGNPAGQFFSRDETFLPLKGNSFKDNITKLIVFCLCCPGAY